MLGDSVVDQKVPTGVVEGMGKGVAWWPLARINGWGSQHATLAGGHQAFRWNHWWTFSRPDCWRDWLHYSFLMKRLLGLSKIHRDITKKKNSRLINSLIYPSILSKEAVTVDKQKLSTKWIFPETEFGSPVLYRIGSPSLPCLASVFYFSFLLLFQRSPPSS